VTIHLQAVPTRLQSRVGSVNLIGVNGGLVVGSLIEGALAQHFGIAAPFWFAFVGSAVFVVLIWRDLRHIAHTDKHDVPQVPTQHSPSRKRVSVTTKKLSNLPVR